MSMSSDRSGLSWNELHLIVDGSVIRRLERMSSSDESEKMVKRNATSYATCHVIKCDSSFPHPFKVSSYLEESLPV